MKPTPMRVIWLAVMASSAPPTCADTLALRCERADVINPKWSVPLTFDYDNDARTLKVAGPFGSFAIPGKREPLEIMAGVMGEAIDGVAKTAVSLPALADLEACIAENGDPSAGADSDANARDTCLQKLSAAGAPVDAVAQIRIGIFPESEREDGEAAFVLFKLRYDAQSRYFDGKMIVETFPARCSLRE